jgi:multiple sugar transport system substrate-binding protein
VAVNAGPEGEAVKKLAADYPGAKLEFQDFPYDSLRQQLLSVFRAGTDTFDIVMVDDPWFPELAENFVDLNDVPPALLNDFVKTSLDLCRYPYRSGSLRALPFVGNTEALFYRRDVLSRFHLDAPPTNWEEVARTAKQITASSQSVLGKQVYGYAIRGKSGAPVVTDFLPIYWSLGGRLLDDNANPRFESVDPALFRRALEIYRELKDASPPGATNYDWPEMTTDFIKGRVAMELNWPTAIPDLESKVAKTDKGRAWALALPPGQNGPGTSMIGNWLLAVPSKSADRQSAQAAIIWLSEQQQRVATALNPPTRESVFAALAASGNAEYFGVIGEALRNSTARDRTPAWPTLEEAVSRSVTEYLAGRATAAIATEHLVRDIDRVFPKQTPSR